MDRFTLGLGLALVLGLAPRLALAQQADAPQDPKLDNLVHETGYKTAPPGTLGAVVERGNGQIDMVLV